MAAATSLSAPRLVHKLPMKDFHPMSSLCTYSIVTISFLSFFHIENIVSNQLFLVNTISFCYHEKKRESGYFMNTSNTNNTHKRRVRYKGTHPTRFEEKYKELQPDKYTDTIEKIIQKGSTPAGMHIPICLNEIMGFLNVQPGQTGIDCTLGYGGHAQELLSRLNGSGHLHATDVDALELPKTTQRLEDLGYGASIFTPHNQNYSTIDKIAEQFGPFDFILADLGVSSMQIDNPARGFSYKTQGPLDLRLDPTKGISARERLKEIDPFELEGMLFENADEPYAHQIAQSICSHISKGQAIETTSDLRAIITDTLSKIPEANQEDKIKKSCQRCFQALRIDVNNEFEELFSFLEKLPNCMSQGGKVAILTFHSGEDRLVKKAFKEYYKNGVFSEISSEAIRPSAEECMTNPRARSAKLRTAIR